jgi:hypothetical protein
MGREAIDEAIAALSLQMETNLVYCNDNSLRGKRMGGFVMKRRGGFANWVCA